jgi:hypothetical protein
MFEEKNRRRGFPPHIEQVAGNAQKDRRTGGQGLLKNEDL